MFFTDFIEFACRICTFGLNMSDAYLLSLSVNPFRAFFLSCHPERKRRICKHQVGVFRCFTAFSMTKGAFFSGSRTVWGQ